MVNTTILSNNNINENILDSVPNQTASSTDIPVIYYVIVLVTLMVCCLAMILIFYWYHHRNLVNLIRTNKPAAAPKIVQQCIHPEQVFSIEHTSNNNHNMPILIPIPSPTKSAMHKLSVEDSSTQKSFTPKPKTIAINVDNIEEKNRGNIYAVNNNKAGYIYNPYTGLPIFVPGEEAQTVPTVPVSTTIVSLNSLNMKSDDSNLNVVPTEARTALSDITTSSSEESMIDEEDNFDSVSTRMKTQRKSNKKRKHSKKLSKIKDGSRSSRKMSNDTNITFKLKENKTFIEPDIAVPTTLTDVTTTTVRVDD